MPSFHFSMKTQTKSNHYMINKPVNFSPYYAEHYDSIKHLPNAKSIIAQKSDGEYIYSKTQSFDLLLSLEALMSNNLFKPISTLDYIKFNSLIPFENINNLDTLEYIPELCCKAKN